MTASSPLRLFIALPLPTATQQALGTIIQDLKRSSAAVRWVRPDHIHLTLRFLGDTDPALVPELRRVIDKAAARRAALPLTLDRLGAFPNLRSPRVYWLSAMSPAETEPLCELAEEIEFAVREIGFAPEKKLFKPHLTLGRVKQPDNLAKLGQVIDTYRLPPIRALLDELVLFQSTLTPQGPIYKKLHAVSLGGERFE